MVKNTVTGVTPVAARPATCCRKCAVGHVVSQVLVAPTPASAHRCGSIRYCPYTWERLSCDFPGLSQSASDRLPAIQAPQGRDRERRSRDRTSRPLMPLERRRFMAAVAVGLLAAPLMAQAQDCASPT